MKPHPVFTARRLVYALAACGIASSVMIVARPADAGRASAQSFDPLLSDPGRACGPIAAGQPALLKALILARTETTPFQPAPMKAAGLKFGCAAPCKLIPPWSLHRVRPGTGDRRHVPGPRFFRAPQTTRSALAIDRVTNRA